MHLLYLTFGEKTTVHTQAAFSIYSFFKTAGSVDSINIITDAPNFYQHFGNRVNVIPVSKAELQEWEGPYRFFWRVKLKALEQVCSLYPAQPVMYLDTDTFLAGNLAEIQKGLLEGKSWMHENEGALSHKKSKTEKRMWQQIQGKTFGGLAMQPHDCMWNAGLVATPNTRQQEECRQAIAICDEMCTQGVTRRLIEQYALSLVLQHHYGLQEANQQVVHYWSVKELWNNSIDTFFLQAYCRQWSFDETLSQVKQYDFTALPIALRTRKTNVRLKHLADRFFPPQHPVYLPPSPIKKP